MAAYKIVADSSCDIPFELSNALNIDLVSFYVSFDKEMYYKEGVEISTNEFYDKIVSEKVYPKTSLPSINDYCEAFEKNLSQGLDVVCICLSCVFSGSYQSAINAKSIALESYPDRRIEIVDSVQATGGEGLVVYQAIKMQQAGYSIDKLLDVINELKYTAVINFTVNSLDYLEHGGRIGKAGALAGALLNIKPIIVMAKGELFPHSKIRGHKKAISTLLSKTFSEIGNNSDDYDFCVLTAHSLEGLDTIKEDFKNRNIPILLPNGKIGVTITTHTGPTAIGIAYIKKFNSI